jgi:hypothetical protein
MKNNNSLNAGVSNDYSKLFMERRASEISLFNK